MNKADITIHFVNGQMETFLNVFSVETGKMFFRMEMPYRTVSLRYEDISRIDTSYIKSNDEYFRYLYKMVGEI